MVVHCNRRHGPGFGVWGLGFGLWALGFGVWGLGFGFRETALREQRGNNNDTNIEQILVRGWATRPFPVITAVLAADARQGGWGEGTAVRIRTSESGRVHDGSQNSRS